LIITLLDVVIIASKKVHEFVALTSSNKSQMIIVDGYIGGNNDRRHQNLGLYSTQEVCYCVYDQALGFGYCYNAQNPVIVASLPLYLMKRKFLQQR
jgi:hypothetical protein